MFPGDLLTERFEIEHRVSVGGMGEVFRARDRTSGEAVAVKVLSDAREQRIARFVCEVQSLAALSHPGIVRYISHGVSPLGEPFLVMEWLEGEDLEQRLARGPLTAGEALALATRVAEALGAAHARGVVHRDLNPSNLFLPGGNILDAKVLDFGIARREGQAQLTKTGVMLGTPGFMAPEQARDAVAGGDTGGDPGGDAAGQRGNELDARADVFALGCVLFQCLTGTRAFDGDGHAAILHKLLFDEAPRVGALWPEVPAALDDLVARMLAKAPGDRPPDGARLASELLAIAPLVDGAAVAPRGGSAKRSAITVGERRLQVMVLLGPAAVDRPEPDPEPDPAAVQRAVQPYGGRLEPLPDGSAIVVFKTERQVATDQAAQAARCALAIRALSKRRPIAVVMGRAEPAMRLPAPMLRPPAPGEGGAAASWPAPPPGAAAEPPPILLDKVVAGLLGARFEVVERAAGTILCGERPLLQSARTLLGRPTSYVGRDWELSALTGILDECIDEPEARVAVVTGAAGMGKTRLGAELIRRIRERPDPVAIWIGRGDSLRAGSTLYLLAQALRGALGIRGGEPLAERRDRLRARIATRVPAADQQRVTELLGELIGTPFPVEESSPALKAARQDAQLMSEQMRKAFLDFLQAETAVHPVLIILEDLHWGDFGTVRFIDTALRERAKLPWMVLALARPEVYEVLPRLWAERNVQEIRLKALGKKAGERLVRQALGDSVEPDTVERLVQLADGNAFYLEELIRAVADGKDGALPDTVLVMVETRLARLPLEARRVLRAASVFGEVSWESGVALLLGHAMSARTVSDWLRKLVAQEVLVARPRSRFPGVRELAFRHSLHREGAYATLTEEDRCSGHRLVGEWLEQHGEADAMVLAGHFERGGDGARAARAYLHAAEQAVHILDLDATFARAGLGLGCAPPPDLRLALLGMRCEAATYASQLLAAVLPEAEEVLGAAPPGSLPWAQAALAYLEGTLVTGRISDFMAAAGALHEVAPAPEAMSRMALTYVGAACLLDVVGHVAQGSTMAERFRAAIHATGDREPLARFWWHVLVGMRSAYASEDPWDGYRHSEAIREIFDVIGGERVLLNMQLFRGMNLWYLGALEPAAQALAEIPAADESLGVVSSLRRFCLAWLLADRGMLGEARALAAELAEYGRAQKLPLEELRGRWVLAEVLRRAGDLEGAERELSCGLGMAVPPLEHPGVLGTLAALRLAQGRATEALEAAADATARCAAMGGCGMFRGAFVQLAHGEALHATGAHDAARRVIGEARARLLATADRITDPAYRQSFLRDVPENARTLALAGAWQGDAPTA
ncbi:MAG TPA: protein kinase [Kofleriaceae bacterium]|nr:protein kinase [Kofleriaceae bacterium]